MLHSPQWETVPLIHEIGCDGRPRHPPAEAYRVRPSHSEVHRTNARRFNSAETPPTCPNEGNRVHATRIQTAQRRGLRRGGAAILKKSANDCLVTTTNRNERRRLLPPGAYGSPVTASTTPPSPNRTSSTPGSPADAATSAHSRAAAFTSRIVTPQRDDFE